MSNSHTVKINEGQTLLLYSGDKILLRKKYEQSGIVITSWSSFVGTEAEVDGKIQSLSLSVIVKPKPVAEKKTLLQRFFNFLKTILSK